MPLASLAQNGGRYPLSPFIFEKNLQLTDDTRPQVSDLCTDEACFCHLSEAMIPGISTDA